MDVLNHAYNKHGITFRLVDTDYTVDDLWATGYFNHEMKPFLRRGTYEDLNVYLLTDFHDGLLGICHFPQETVPGSWVFERDGCKVWSKTVPGGGTRYYSLGGTLFHEVGHWFGLRHVFQGHNCTGQGDCVMDTPPQLNATFGCPDFKDSCPDMEGVDSIRNYMDYSWDCWWV